MRSLRVLGVTSDGAGLICAATANHASSAAKGAEHFTIPIDERLRAVALGKEHRFGQLEIDMTPQLTPREIQRRIRAGASVDEVAGAAACDPERIERFAYPILLERVTVVDRACAVRPLRDAAIGTALAASADSSLATIVTETLADRGHQGDVHWDSFKDERGWALTATWHVGRTENYAEWSYATGPDGGIVTARNTQAQEFVEPGPRRLRTVGGGSPQRSETIAHDDVPGDAPADADARTATDAPRLTADEYAVAQTVTDERSAAHADGAASVARATGTTGRTTAAARSTRRKNHPPMPSWEDVLLGTRTAER